MQPFMPSLKLAMTLSFTVIILQPVYLLVIEVYEYQTQKQFYYYPAESGYDYSLITDIVTIVLIYAPAVINYISAVVLIESQFGKTTGLASEAGMVELSQFSYQKGNQDDYSLNAENPRLSNTMI